MRGNRDADCIGLELLRARETCEGKLRFGKREGAGRRIGDDIGNDPADEFGFARMFFAKFGVPRDDVAHFMGQDRGELGVVVGQRD